MTSTITIGDVDEFDISTIADLNSMSDRVAENSPNGTVVGITANAFDLDATQNTISYLLSDDAGGRFAIDSVSGLVTVANGSLLNFEAVSSHGIRVVATSADGSTSIRDFTIAVSDVNERPLGFNDSFSTSYIDTLVNFAGGGVLANDRDPDSDMISAFLISGPAVGSFVLGSDGGFTYVPMAGFIGTVTFVYRVTDGSLVSDDITASILVTLPDNVPGGDGGGGSGGGNSGGSGNGTGTSNTTATITQSDPKAASPLVGDQSFSNTNASVTVTSQSTPVVAIGETPVMQDLGLASESESVGIDFSSSNTRLDATGRSGGSRELAGYQDDSLGHRGRVRQGENDNHELTTRGSDSFQEDSDRNFFTTESVVNTVLGTGIVIWIIQGAQILAAILSTAPALIQLDPLSILPKLETDEKEDPDADSAGNLFDKKG